MYLNSTFTVCLSAITSSTTKIVRWNPLFVILLTPLATTKKGLNYQNMISTNYNNNMSYTMVAAVTPMD